MPQNKFFVEMNLDDGAVAAKAAAQGQAQPAPQPGDWNPGVQILEGDLNAAVAGLKKVVIDPDVIQHQVEPGLGPVFKVKKVFKKPEPKAPKAQLKVLKVGADVEIFLRTPNGAPKTVIGLIGGTKEHPLPVINEKGYALQEDNVALEWNIPASASRHEFVYGVSRIMEEIQARCKKLDVVPAIEASMRFPEDVLRHPQALKFGCEPDFNVWTRSMNESASPDNPEAKTLRTAGGHIHIGFELPNGNAPQMPENVIEIEAVVKALDVFLGVPSIFLDKDKDRRLLYGRAGAFRPKPYGVEYRVLSNFWTRSPELVEWAYQSVHQAVETVNAYNLDIGPISDYQKHIENAINFGNEQSARIVMETFAVRLPKHRNGLQF